MKTPHLSGLAPMFVALAGVASVTATYVTWLHVANATTAAVSYLLIVLLVAAAAPRWVAIVTSIAAVFMLNFFFFPPVGALTITDPQNWIALFAFLAVSLIAGRLAALARGRQHDAVSRRDELARLFNLSRDILLTTDADAEAIACLARHLAARFQLEYVSICLPRDSDFERFDAGVLDLQDLVPTEALRRTFDDGDRINEGTLETQVPTGRQEASSDGRPPVRLAPLRLGTRAIGVLATAGRRIEPGIFNTLGSVVAIAIERIHFLEERRRAELARRSAEFKSALLASLAHDLRTPLTAIRVAADNLHASWLTERQRGEQANLVLTAVNRLTRLFQNILEMTRIEAGAVAQQSRWVDPSEVVEAARNQIEPPSSAHQIDVLRRSDDRVVHIDPRLTSAALAHLLENAAQYSPAGSAITVAHEVNADGLLVTVDDEGSGIAEIDRPRLFEPFFRGEQGRWHTSGTGMGLAIARGLLAAEHGRVWAENRPGGGARFSILVPAQSRPAPVAAENA